MVNNTVLFISIMFLGFPMLKAQDASALVKFEKDEIHLGKVKKGDKVKNQFVFTNISKSVVEIDMVSTCECTIANWTRGKIKPGEKGYIYFTFDSNKKDHVEPIDVDLYFLNTDPKTGNPISSFLKYTFEY